jgi:hypothetical protein
VPLASPEPGAKLETLCTEHVLYVSLVGHQGTLRSLWFLLAPVPPNLHRLGVSDKVIQQILRHANVTTTINIYVKMVTQDPEDAMRKLETKCSLVVPHYFLVFPYLPTFPHIDVYRRLGTIMVTAFGRQLT